VPQGIRDRRSRTAPDLINTRAALSGRWICFDVGETLIDETRVCETWATVLGVTPFSLMAAYGAVILRGQDHRGAFDLVDRPDWADHRQEFDALYGGFRATDLYPDALPTLDALRAAGYRLAILANQPRQRTEELNALAIRVDVIAMSEELGVAKPSPAFFSRALELMDADARDIAYVGDRLDNDVLPATAAGMRAVWLRRGPWGLIIRDDPPAGTVVVDSLTDLVGRIDELWRAE
jgi:HAD superfamily hydrolase (TIGR01662 family)